MNFPEIAALLGKVLKADIQYVNPPIAEYKQALGNAGLPAGVIELFSGIFESIKAAEFDNTTTDLVTILGRKPLSVAEFLSNYYA